MVPSSIEAKYSEVRRSLEALGPKVQSSVAVFCSDNGYAHVSRLKTLESIAEKLETGRFAKWSELDDLFATTIVIPTLNEEQQVLEFLSRTFEEVALKLRGSSAKPPDTFRFEATRFIGRLRTPAGLSPEPEALIPFEVQVRTAFEHAWSVTTHKLTYKAGTVDWRRLRLAAQLKAAVEQLDLLVLGFGEVAEKVLQHEWTDVSAATGFVTLLQDLFASEVLPLEIKPKDWTRTGENLVSAVRASSTFPSDRRKHAAHFEKARTTLSDEIVSDSAATPRTLSLFQYCFALLARKGVIVPPLRHFHPAITPEAVTLFPVLATFPLFTLDG